MPNEIRFPAAAVAAPDRGNRLEAVKLVRQHNHGLDLRGAKEAVDTYASGRRHFPVDAHAAPGILPFDGLPTEAIGAIQRGQLVEAIKIVRDTTGLGLKAARDLVDGYRKNTENVPDLRIDGEPEARA
ncbi:MAG TPA: ribosomal protein L7/L12 [Pseudoxanthomonas sp.]|nr:ribosomal protein L7/L12 [Pseudoxanthomonas sp.]